MTALSRAPRQITSFAAIGVASTAAYLALFAATRTVLPAAAANALALVATAVANTAANRRLTFGVRGRDGLARDHTVGLVALAAALAVTSGSLVILNAVVPQHSRLAEVAVLLGANATATLMRFLLLRLALDRNRDSQTSTRPALATLSQSERTRG